MPEKNPEVTVADEAPEPIVVSPELNDPLFIQGVIEAQAEAEAYLAAKAKQEEEDAQHLKEFLKALKSNEDNIDRIQAEAEAAREEAEKVWLDI